MTARDHPGRRTVLITGGAGFIGSVLCARLRAMGHSVVVYDDFSRGWREHLPADVEVVPADIRDSTRVQAAIASFKPDSVVHLAAMHFVPDCIARPGETMDLNVGGTRTVLEACRFGRVKRVLFASSAAVYEPTDDPCVEDSTPLRPVEVYGESKLAAEKLVRAFHEETGIASGILRLFNAVGRNETNPHVIPHIFESLRESDVISLGDMAPCRDYVDTRDIADAVVAVEQRLEGLRVFNVGTGVASSVHDILEMLRGILHRPVVAVQDASRLRPTERMRLVADIERIRRETSWTPRFSLRDTLLDLAAAYGLLTQPIE